MQRTAASPLQYEHKTCALCAQPFGKGESAPRILKCGHTFCTGCINSKLLITSTQHTSTFKCPVDCNVTHVRRGNASSLRRLDPLTSSRPPLFRIYLKNMAGDSQPLIVTHRSTVRDVKKLMRRADPTCAVQLQRLSKFTVDGQLEPLNHGDATLGDLGIGSEQLVSLVVASEFPGALGRTITLDFAPGGICFSSSGDCIFATDPAAKRVRVLQVADGSTLRTIGGGDCLTSEPMFLCLSPDGALLFVSDALAYSVLVFCVADGALARRIGPGGQGPNECRYPMAMCVSGDGQHLFIADRDNGRVHAKRVTDGTHVHSTGGDGSLLSRFPCGICVSGDEVIVADSNRSRLVAYRAADGAHVRTIGSNVVSGDCFIDPLFRPYAVCVSKCGTWLFVSIAGRCIYVVRAADGVLVSSITTGAHSLCVSPSTGELVCSARNDEKEHVLQFYSCQ